MSDAYKDIELEQLRNRAKGAAAFAALKIPSDGWIKTVRRALGMTGNVLGKRMGSTQSNVALLEKSEREERATLKSMREAASAMGCRFVYAIVPPEGESIESIIEAQAERRARRIVRDASVHMTLEAQQLGEEDTVAEIERLKKRLLDKMPRDFWDPAGDDA